MSAVYLPTMEIRWYEVWEFCFNDALISCTPFQNGSIIFNKKKDRLFLVDNVSEKNLESSYGTDSLTVILEDMIL